MLWCRLFESTIVYKFCMQLDQFNEVWNDIWEYVIQLWLNNYIEIVCTYEILFEISFLRVKGVNNLMYEIHINIESIVLLDTLSLKIILNFTLFQKFVD